MFRTPSPFKSSKFCWMGLTENIDKRSVRRSEFVLTGEESEARSVNLYDSTFCV